MNIFEMKASVLENAKKSFDEGLFAGTSGNLSMFDGQRMAITPSSIAYTKLTAQDIMIIELDGSIIEGTNRPSTEWRMHAEVYKQRKDVFAVVHTHSPYATSFSVLREVIPLIQVEMIPYLGGEIYVADFAIPGTAEMGASALAALKKRNSCLLANHGAIAIGKTLEDAQLNAVYTEEVSRLYYLAKTCDRGKVSYVPKDASDFLREKYGFKE